MKLQRSQPQPWLPPLSQATTHVRRLRVPAPSHRLESGYVDTCGSLPVLLELLEIPSLPAQRGQELCMKMGRLPIRPGRHTVRPGQNDRIEGKSGQRLGAIVDFCLELGQQSYPVACRENGFVNCRRSGLDAHSG